MSKKELPKVNILLATYNGKKHLEKQLDSLVNQSYDNIDIYIRDDGSKDGTVEFLQEYISKNTSNKKFYLMDSKGINLRCPGSFYEIARHCQPAKYYAFCDQDDEWYPEKITWAVERLEQENNQDVLVYFSGCDYKFSDGSFIRTSPAQDSDLKLHEVLYYTPGSGFTMVFNEAARQKLIVEPELGKELHDRWLIRGAVCLGKTIYDERRTAAHIRHEEAVTAGDSDDRSLLKQFIENELKGDDAKHDKEALAYFYHCFKENLNSEQKKLLELFSSSKPSVALWFKKVFYPKRLRRRLPGELALRMLFFIGKI